MKLLKDLFLPKAHSEKISQQIILMADDAVVALDQDMHILLINKSAEHMYGYKAEELIGQPYNLLIPEHQRREENNMLTRFMLGDEARQVCNERGHMFNGLRKGGEEFPTHMTILKYEHGRNTSLGFIIKDISHDKESEEERLRFLTTDALTGLYNRRHFIQCAENEAVRARRYGRPLSILIMDIDKFQDFNTEHGHEAGDKLLQKISIACQRALRSMDMIGRWSGGGFIFLLPETQAENAQVIANRLCTIVSRTAFKKDCDSGTCTASIGISEFRKTEVNIDLPISRAAKAVSQTKKNGGGRAVIEK